MAGVTALKLSLPILALQDLSFGDSIGEYSMITYSMQPNIFYSTVLLAI